MTVSRTASGGGAKVGKAAEKPARKEAGDGVLDDNPLQIGELSDLLGYALKRAQLKVFEDFLRKVWKDGLQFHKLDIANPEPLPIGPTTVIGDNVGFTRST